MYDEDEGREPRGLILSFNRFWVPSKPVENDEGREGEGWLIVCLSLNDVTYPLEAVSGGVALLLLLESDRRGITSAGRVRTMRPRAQLLSSMSEASMSSSSNAKKRRLNDTVDGELQHFDGPTGDAGGVEEESDGFEEELDEDNCSICLQLILDRTVVPDCSHEFCFDCILTWSSEFSLHSTNPRY